MKKFTHCLAVASILFATVSGVVYASVGVPRTKFKLPKNQTVRTHVKGSPEKAPVFSSKLNIQVSKTSPQYADANVTLYGDVIYSDNWEETSDYGVYSINTSTGSLSSVSSTGDYNFRATGGAVYKDGHYYLIKGDEYSATWYDYSTDSWEEENEGEEGSTWLASDMTVSPADKKIYAAMSDGNGGQELTTVDFNSESRTVIGSLTTSLVTLSADAYGQLYGIGANGVLYKVDASTAEETAVGSTGVSPTGMQSATFDYATGNLYWAASTDKGVGALYIVDTTTGTATRQAVFSGNEQIVGLYSLSEAQAWEGADMPSAPTDVTATYSNGQSVITWSAPTKGLHNGTFDETETKYDIIRLPDSVTVAHDITATTYTDNFTPSQLGAYTYEVTAKNSVGTGGSAKSNAVVAGNAVTPPYSQTFTDEASFSLLTMVDADGDGSTWSASAINKCAHEPGAPFESSDDWLFTPRLALKSDRLYRLRFAVSAAFAANYPYNVKAAIGTAPTEDAATQTVQESVRIALPDTTSLGGYFKVTGDGEYYVGVNVSGYDIQDILLHYLYVDEGPKFTAPDSVTSLKVTPGIRGMNIATLSFTAPSKTVGGDNLSSISSIKVYRGTTLIKTLTDVTPNGSYTVTDNAPAANTFNSYNIVAENAEGSGLAAEATAFIGTDTSLPPTNVKASLDPNNAGKVLLTWTAPVTGVNGGYIGAGNLSYGIQRAIGGSGTASVLQNTYAGTTYTDDIDNTGEQAYQIYGVAACNSRGYSDVATSNAIIKGAPYALPFAETFPNGSRKYFWIAATSSDNGNASWGFGNDYQTGDYYFQYSHSYRAGDDAIITSGKIATDGAANPILEYSYWYRAEEGDDSLNVYLIKNGTDTVLVDDEPYTLYQNSKDFEKVTVPLAQYIDANTKFIQVAFYVKTYSSDAMQSAAVKGITVRDQQDYDLMAQSLSVPQKAISGDTISITTSVRNYGSKTAGAYIVDLLESGKVIATQQAADLKADSLRTFSFKVPVGTLKDTLAFSFRVDYDADLVLANNGSESDTTAVTLPVYPSPQSGSYTSNGSNEVDLTWQVPEFSQFTVPATDGAEDYASFAIDGLGGWTARDRDGNSTRSDIQVDWNDVNYTHKGEPMAWIVMNPTEAGAPLTNWMDEPTGWQPVSGKQYFASISNTTGTNDDWLISPELNGDAQTVSFYQHGYYGMEQYEVLYSTTDTAAASFTSLGVQQSASSWTKVSFDLPEGTKYFAIRNLGAEYSQYFFVDDIEFRPQSNKGVLRLNKYNVYRDGDKIGETEATAHTYADNDVPNGNHVYQVTAVYNLGESSAATIEASTTSGITDIQVDNATNLLDGSRLTSSEPVDVYSIDGKRLFHGTAIDGITLPAGTYIIRTATQTAKVIVR